MRVVHLLRKYDAAEWGGTETAVQGLMDGLRRHEVTPLLYCPRLVGEPTPGGAAENRCGIKRFRTCVPVWGMSRQHKRQLIAVGGNLMSFDLLPMLWRERDVSVIHTHTLGRLGGIASTAARSRGVPFVVSIHGGLLALPAGLKSELNGASRGGFEWGRIFGLFFQSRRLLSHADAVLTGNREEAELLRRHNPGVRIEVQPHGIPTALYRIDQRAAARAAFPQICNRKLLLSVGRIDPVKNQEWLIAQAPEIFRKHPQALMLLVGPCTDAAYGERLNREIQNAGLGDRVLRCGGLPAADARLVGLYQEAQAVILPSVSESFGLVVLEAWAAGTVVIASRTAGALTLINQGENGWLFDLEKPGEFQAAVDMALGDAAARTSLANAGCRLARAQYDVVAVAGRIKGLYDELLEARRAIRNSARR